MQWVSWLLIAMNITGAAIMVKFGLPREIPFVGRQEADPLLGYLGLMLFVSSIAIRATITLTS